MNHPIAGLNIAFVCVDAELLLPEITKAIAAKTKEPPKLVYQRWWRWLCKEPDSWKKLEKDLKAIGYKITIEKI